jgi:hypothetical protein
MSLVHHSPFSSDVQPFEATTVPSPVGGQDSIRHVPVAFASQK